MRVAYNVAILNCSAVYDRALRITNVRVSRRAGIYFAPNDAGETGMRKSQLWILLVSVMVFAADKRSFETWQSYAGGPDSSQYSALKQINKSNVRQLEMAWSYPIGGGALTFGPIEIGRAHV